MSERHYVVEVPVVGLPGPYQLAVCGTPEAAAELVRVLVAVADVPSVTVRVSVMVAPPAGPPPF